MWLDTDQTAARACCHVIAMAVDPVFRRMVAVALGIFGVVLMLAAPDTLPGLGVLALAVVIEVVGVVIDRRR
jgi:hypothetical protein